MRTGRDGHSSAIAATVPNKHPTKANPAQVFLMNFLTDLRDPNQPAKIVREPAGWANA
jgi:hypothetical protein